MKDRRLHPALLVAALLLAASAAHGTDAPTTATGDRLRVVFSGDVFSSVNRADAIASTRVWMESVGRRRGIHLSVEVDTYETQAELREVVRTGGADLFIMNTMHYLDLGALQERVPPSFVPERDGVALTEYVLLTRAEPSLSLADLRGRKIIFLRTVGITLARSWMTLALREERLGTIPEYFGSTEDAEKPSAAVLPVFFGQADACVVDRGSLKLMQELNPQLGTALRVSRTATPYLETVLCVRRDYQEHRELLLEGLPELPADPSGKQILLVFRTDRILPFDESRLTTVRALHDALQPAPEAELR